MNCFILLLIVEIILINDLEDEFIFIINVYELLWNMGELLLRLLILIINNVVFVNCLLLIVMLYVIDVGVFGILML